MIPLFLSLFACADAGASDPVPAATVSDADARAVVGLTAPDFSATGIDGTEFNLSDHAGKTVVLEWFNPGCPFVKSAHGKGPLQDLPGTWTEQGVVWVAINSGAAGKQGTGVAANQRAADKWDMDYPVLLDETGVVGMAYGAKTTPQMVVIAPDGKVAFNGALDNAPMGNTSGGAAPVPYTDEAIRAVVGGQPVSLASPKPWGCSVKYGS